MLTFRCCRSQGHFGPSGECVLQQNRRRVHVHQLAGAVQLDPPEVRDARGDALLAGGEAPDPGACHARNGVSVRRGVSIFKSMYILTGA